MTLVFFAVKGEATLKGLTIFFAKYQKKNCRKPWQNYTYRASETQFYVVSELELLSLRLLTKMAFVPSRVETFSESSSHSISNSSTTVVPALATPVVNGHLMCTALLSMSRHISMLNYLRSADTCLPSNAVHIGHFSRK